MIQGGRTDRAAAPKAPNKSYTAGAQGAWSERPRNKRLNPERIVHKKNIQPADKVRRPHLPQAAMTTVKNTKKRKSTSSTRSNS